MTTEIPALQKTLQETNEWLSEVQAGVGGDRQRSYHALRSVLHTLRDRLSPDENANLAAQLPMLLRGLYYEGWKPSRAPMRIRARQEFLDQIQERYDLAGIDPELAARTVFGCVERHVDAGEVDKLRGLMPEEIRGLWAEPVRS